MFIGFIKTIYVFYRTFYYYLRSSNHFEENTLLKKNWALEVLDIIGFKIHTYGKPHLSNNLILVGNHISYLDIIVLFAVYPDCVFLAKSEVRRWPIIGPAAKKIGTLFVQRDSKQSREDSRNKIHSLLSSNFQTTQIAVFPSGTTTLNEDKPWKKGLFEVAKSTNTLIQPFKIQYSHQRECAYIDNDQLFSSLMGLFNLKNKSICFSWGSAFAPNDLDQDIESTRLWTQSSPQNDSFKNKIDLPQFESFKPG